MGASISQPSWKQMTGARIAQTLHLHPLYLPQAIRALCERREQFVSFFAYRGLDAVAYYFRPYTTNEMHQIPSCDHILLSLQALVDQLMPLMHPNEWNQWIRTWKLRTFLESVLPYRHLGVIKDRYLLPFAYAPEDRGLYTRLQFAYTLRKCFDFSSLEPGVVREHSCSSHEWMSFVPDNIWNRMSPTLQDACARECMMVCTQHTYDTLHQLVQGDHRAFALSLIRARHTCTPSIRMRVDTVLFSVFVHGAKRQEEEKVDERLQEMWNTFVATRENCVGVSEACNLFYWCKHTCIELRVLEFVLPPLFASLPFVQEEEEFRLVHNLLHEAAIVRRYHSCFLAACIRQPKELIPYLCPFVWSARLMNVGCDLRTMLRTHLKSESPAQIEAFCLALCPNEPLVVRKEEEKEPSRETDRDAPCCTICLEAFSLQRLPKSLHCGHSCCAICMQQVYKTSKQEGEIACPICRRSSKFASWEDIPNNFTACEFLNRTV